MQCNISLHRRIKEDENQRNQLVLETGNISKKREASVHIADSKNNKSKVVEQNLVGLPSDFGY